MMPAGSRPKIAGSGRVGRGSGLLVAKKLVMTRCKFGTIPQALTSTSTSVGRGSGISMRSSCIGEPYSCTRAAIMLAIFSSRRCFEFALLCGRVVFLRKAASVFTKITEPQHDGNTHCHSDHRPRHHPLHPQRIARTAPI